MNDASCPNTISLRVLTLLATETEQDRPYRISLNEGPLHCAQRTSKSHLGICRRNSHVHYDVPENVRLP
jgi:hypothetical protein